MSNYDFESQALVTAQQTASATTSKKKSSASSGRRKETCWTKTKKIFSPFEQVDGMTSEEREAELNYLRSQERIQPDPTILDLSLELDANNLRMALLEEKRRISEAQVHNNCSSVEGMLKYIVETETEAIQGINLWEDGDVDVKYEVLKFKDSTYLAVRAIKKTKSEQPAPSESVDVLAEEDPSLEIQVELYSTLTIFQISMEDDSDPRLIANLEFPHLHSRHVTYFQNGRFLYFLKVEDTDADEPTFKLIICCLNLLDKEVTEIKQIDVPRGEKLSSRKVCSAIFLRDGYDGERDPYNQQVPHQEFLDNCTDFVGLISESPSEEGVYSMSIRTINNLNEEMYFADGLLMGTAGLTTLIGNRNVRDYLQLEDSSFVLSIIHDDMQKVLLLLLDDEGNKFVDLPAFDGKFRQLIRNQIVLNVERANRLHCRVITAHRESSDYEQHYFDEKLLATEEKFIYQYQIPKEIHKLFLPNHPKLILYDPSSSKKLLFLTKHSVFIGKPMAMNTMTSPCKHLVEIKGSDVEEVDDRLSYNPSAFKASKIIKQLKANFADGGGLKVNIASSHTEQYENVNVLDEGVVLFISEKMKFENLQEVEAPTVSVRFFRDRQLVHLFAGFGGDSQFKLAFKPLASVVQSEGSIHERVQLATSSPVVRVLNESGDKVKMYQNYQVCLYGDDTQMLEIREFEVSWQSNRSEVRATTSGIKIIGDSTYDQEEAKIADFMFTPLVKQDGSRDPQIMGTQLLIQHENNQEISLLTIANQIKPRYALLTDYGSTFLEFKARTFFFGYANLGQPIMAKHLPLKYPQVLGEADRQLVLHDQLLKMMNSAPLDPYEIIFSSTMERVQNFLSGNFNPFMPLPFFMDLTLFDLQMQGKDFPQFLRELTDRDRKDHDKVMQRIYSPEFVQSRLESLLSKGDSSEERITALLRFQERGFLFNNYHESTLHLRSRQGQYEKTAMVLKHLYNLHSAHDSYGLMMSLLPLVLDGELPNIQGSREKFAELIFRFFGGDDSGLKFCSPISNSKFSRMMNAPFTLEFFQVNQDYFAHDTTTEVERKIIEKEESRRQNQDFTVDNYTVDLRRLHLQRQLSMFYDESKAGMKHLVQEMDKMRPFTSLTLAELLERIIRSNRQGLQNMTEIKRIVDHQFKTQTEPFLKKRMFYYALIYLLPFFAQVFIDQAFLVILCSLLCLGYLIFEIHHALLLWKQLKWWQLYKLITWKNSKETVYFFIHIYYFLHRLLSPGQQVVPPTKNEEAQDLNTSLPLVLGGIFVLYKAMARLLFYLSIYPQVASLLQGLTDSYRSMKTFLVIFLIFTIGYSLIFQTLGMQFPEEEREYPLVNPFFTNLIQTYRNQLRDNEAPDYSFWEEKIGDFSLKKLVVVICLWISWFSHQFIAAFILLSFLTARILQEHKQTLNMRQFRKYLHLNKLNKECALFQTSRGKEECFDHLLIWLSKEGEMPADEWEGDIKQMEKLFVEEQMKHEMKTRSMLTFLKDDESKMQDVFVGGGEIHENLLGLEKKIRIARAKIRDLKRTDKTAAEKNKMSLQLKEQLQQLIVKDI